MTDLAYQFAQNFTSKLVYFIFPVKIHNPPLIAVFTATGTNGNLIVILNI